MKIVLKNGTVVSEDQPFVGDVLIDNHKIAKIGVGIDVPGAEEIDCTGKFILPGVIDAHVHFRSPGFEHEEDWQTGSRAAVMGGVTTVFDMPNTNPPTNTLKALEEKRALAQAKSLVNFGLFFGGNVEEVKKAQGIVGVKVYMGQTTAHDVDEGSIERLLGDLFNATDRVIAVHAEDELMIRKRMEIYRKETKPEIHSLIRNDAVALKAAKTAVHLAKKYSGRLHVCHLSTKKEVELMAKYPDENITCEVAPHHLFFTVAEYAKQGNFVKVNPPLRSQNDLEALWDALRNDLIDIVATDHAPHLKKDKKKGYWLAPAGIPGVEFVLPLMLDSVNDGRLTLKDVVRILCERPARIYGIQDKGLLAEGYDADITVVDMDEEREVGNVVSKCGWTPYAGMKLKGWPVMTFVRGNLVMEDGKIVSGRRGLEVLGTSKYSVPR